jgi:hypothetical protein
LTTTDSTLHDLGFRKINFIWKGCHLDEMIDMSYFD